jgi:YD repeat-containing protein
VKTRKKKNAKAKTKTKNRNSRRSSKTVRAANGNRTRYTYDKRGRVVALTDLSPNSFTYEYDAQGNFLRVIPPRKSKPKI